MQEMEDVDIYIESDSITPKEKKRQYMYLLECRSLPGNTRSGGSSLTGTYNMATLKALEEAMERIRKPCRIYIHSRNEWMISMIEHQLQIWKEKEFRNGKGNPIANFILWKQIAELAEGHELIGIKGKHIYTSWMYDQMKKGEQDVR